MATDQKAATASAEPDATGSPIENELPTYRAITQLAVASVLCGALAVCSFAHPIFYGFSILAIVLGIAAHRAIKRYPDILTGQRLANAGIALGLVFGLVAGTVATVQYYIVSRDAVRFAKEYADVLQRHSLGEILWNNLGPESRKEKSQADALKDLEANMAKQRMMVEQKMGQMLALQKRLASSAEQKIHYVRIESLGEDDNHGQLLAYALALYELEGPAPKGHPEQEHQYVLAILKGRQKGRQYDWWVEDIRYPYTPQSYVTQAPLVDDDGHGHAH